MMARLMQPADANPSGAGPSLRLPVLVGPAVPLALVARQGLAAQVDHPARRGQQALAVPVALAVPPVPEVRPDST